MNIPRDEMFAMFQKNDQLVTRHMMEIENIRMDRSDSRDLEPGVTLRVSIMPRRYMSPSVESIFSGPDIRGNGVKGFHRFFEGAGFKTGPLGFVQNTVSGNEDEDLYSEIVTVRDGGWITAVVASPVRKSGIDGSRNFKEFTEKLTPYLIDLQAVSSAIGNTGSLSVFIELDNVSYDEFLARKLGGAMRVGLCNGAVFSTVDEAAALALKILGNMIGYGK